ncbi:unnamed protein product [Urochloa humidicola]
MITTQGGNISTNQITAKVPIVMGSKLFKADLISIGLEGMDIILGMDWMNKHKVTLDLSERVVEIRSPILEHSTLYLPSRNHTTSSIFSMTTAARKCFRARREGSPSSLVSGFRVQGGSCLDWIQLGSSELEPFCPCSATESYVAGKINALKNTNNGSKKKKGTKCVRGPE